MLYANFIFFRRDNLTMSKLECNVMAGKKKAARGL